MILKKKLFFFIPLFFYLNSSAQTGREIIIVDSKTKQPIVYATIKSMQKNIATYTNTDGIFNLTSDYGDSIYVSCVGYLSKKIQKNKIIDKQIDLVQQVFELNPVIVKSKKSIGEKTLGIKDAGKSVIWCSGGYGDEFAQKITIPDSTKTYKLNTIFIGAERFDETIPMILHVYNMGDDSMPNTDMLTKPILLKKDNFKKNKKRIVINVSNENIFISEKYFFVGVQWLPVEKKRATLPSSALILTDEKVERFTYTRGFFYSKDKWMGTPKLVGYRPNQTNPNNTIISVIAYVYE